jgi:hypothetical protein
MAKKNKTRFRRTTSTQQPGAATEIKSEEFNPDYSDVIKDLKRIGILAGCFFIVLITLSFVLG